jgi:hypothetical protein
MPVTPIEARCRRCAGDFHLFEVRDQRRGTCPRCGWILSADWTDKLLEDAARADIAQRHLVDALRSLSGLPGNIAVKPHTVLRNLFEEAGWQHDLAADGMLQAELHELRRLIVSWEALDPVTAARPRPSWLRRAAAVLVGKHATERASERDPGVARA